MPDVTIVLPTYNERESLPSVVQDIHAALRAVPHEVLVVDDSSPDGTWQWVEAEAGRDASLRLLKRTTNPGLSAAVLDGFSAARSDRWIVMDADGQHDPALLPQMVQALGTHEMAVATRYAAGGSTGRWTPVRWLGSQVATLLARLILNAPLSDPMSGYFGIRREAYQPVAARMNPRGFKILLELYYRLARQQGRPPRCAELSYVFRTRRAGASKLSSRVIWQYFGMLMALRREERHWPEALPKFLLIGFLGTGVNCATLWGLVRLGSWHHLAAAAVAIQLSVIHNFFWHEHWTFRGPRSGSWVRRFGRYQMSSLVGMVVNWTTLAVLTHQLRWSLIPANLTGIAAGTLLNFILSKLWAWQPRATET